MNNKPLELRIKQRHLLDSEIAIILLAYLSDYIKNEKFPDCDAYARKIVAHCREQIQ
jgi:hypothetical protein